MNDDDDCIEPNCLNEVNITWLQVFVVQYRTTKIWWRHFEVARVSGFIWNLALLPLFANAFTILYTLNLKFYFKKLKKNNCPTFKIQVVRKPRFLVFLSQILIWLKEGHSMKN